MKEYKYGDIIYVKLEKWALDSCSFPPKDCIAKGIFMGYSLKGTFHFAIDEKYKSSFFEIFHCNNSIVDKPNGFEVELI